MIPRRQFLQSCGGAALATLLAPSARAAAKRPNFVFILVDDLGERDLACYGSTFHETPNLDRFATTAMRFTSGYAACPVCSPTRAAIMTGKYPARVHITDWIAGSDPQDRKLLGPQDLHQLPHEETTIAEALRQHGYKTHFVGKWHLGGEGFYPDTQGFDTNIGGWEKGHPYGGYHVPYKNPNLVDGPEGEYLTDRLANESIRFLEGVGQKPFLLYLSFYTVHRPIQACKRHLKKFEEKAAALPPLEQVTIREHTGTSRVRQDQPDYASMVYAMDENVGRVLDKLDELNLADNTVAIFTSDNGGLSTERDATQAPTSNLPLRAGKGWCYEGGIRVPVMVRAPGVTQSGTTCDVPITSTDYYPTILELAGIPAMPDQHRDGVSLVPLLKGGNALDREAIFWHYPHYHGSMWTPGAALRAGDWKLVAFYETDTCELYNLKDDPGEQNDLSKIQPEMTQKLRSMLEAWQRDVGAKMPTPNPNIR